MRMLVGIIWWAGLTLSCAAQTSPDGAARACEASIINGLRSPASYAAVKIDIQPNGVDVLFDAANGFGALLRDRKYCSFVAMGDGLHLIDEPAIAAELGFDACAAEVQNWIKSGNITERAATSFLKQCSDVDAQAQAGFMQTFNDLGVTYPVSVTTTSVSGPSLPQTAN